MLQCSALQPIDESRIETTDENLSHCAASMSACYETTPGLGSSNALRYDTVVILSFADGDTGRLFYRELVRVWGPDILKAGLRKLRILDAATSLEDLKSPPGNRLEKLSGDRAGQWSIRVNDQWRICFVWREGDAYDVEMVDYH